MTETEDVMNGRNMPGMITEMYFRLMPYIFIVYINSTNLKCIVYPKK